MARNQRSRLVTLQSTPKENLVLACTLNVFRGLIRVFRAMNETRAEREKGNYRVIAYSLPSRVSRVAR